MSVTLNTQLEELMFSSQIPDLDLTTSDDNEAVELATRLASNQDCPNLLHLQCE